MSQSQKNMRGIIAMVLAMACFVGNDTLVKLARVHWETGQILVIRGIFSLSMLFTWLRVSGGWSRIGQMTRPLLVLRGGIEATIAVTFITAIGLMSIADITAILMLAPLIITALSMIFFGEKVGWRRWSAVLVGFLGMMLVIRPGGNAMPPFALALALASVIGVGFRDILTGRIPGDIPSVVIALTSTIGTMAGGAVLLASGNAWRPLSGEVIALLAGAAGFVVLGNYAMIEASRDVELSVVSPFRYTVIAWAVLMGIVVFGEWPAPVAMLGIALISGSGLYTLHRERVRRKSL